VARLRPIPASRRGGGATGRASSRARRGAHLGSMGVGVRAEGTTGEGDRQRPAAVAAAARGKRRGRRRLGQQANLGGALGFREARGVVGRRRA
jgi:hypothetical protein